MAPAGAATFLARQTTAVTPPSGVYSLNNYNDPSKCMGVSGGADNAPALLGSCTLAADQAWNVGGEHGTSGYYRLINGDGECLGVSGSSKAPGAAVVAWQCGAGRLDQYWAWQPSSSHPSYYNLVNLNSGLVLSVLNNSTQQGAKIVQEPNQHKANSQLWVRGIASTTAIALPSQQNWAGYSGLPASAGQYVNDVVASWVVPKISCGVGSFAAAAVWAGLWGTSASVSAGQSWLPQIGTDSLCDAGFANYLLAWEMATAPGGGGNGGQLGYQCPSSDGYYNICGNLPTETLVPYGTVAYVNAGDRVSATVEYTSPYPVTSTAQQRTFTISLVDDTTGKYAQGTITTSQPVLPANILGEGGAIVENGNFLGSFTGLAQFSPFTVNASVYGPDSFGVYKWNMQNGSHQLATDGPFVNTGAASPLDYKYSVTWKNKL